MENLHPRQPDIPGPCACLSLTTNLLSASFLIKCIITDYRKTLLSDNLPEDPTVNIESLAPDSTRNLRIFVVAILFVLIGGIVISVAFRELINLGSNPVWFSDFSTMQVSDGFHKVSIPGGNHWEINYEASHEVIFQGQVLHNTPIREKGWEIMTQDILVTTGDFSNPDLVYTRVSDHHFIYRYKTEITPVGTINLLHTLPVNEDIDQQLQLIKPGDEVLIKGWEIYNLTGWNDQNKPFGTWQDQGCNTTLVTEVAILPKE